MIEELFFDAHDSDHVHEVVDCALDLVLNQGVLLDDVVLQLEVFESLNHFLDFAADLGCVLVLKVFDTGDDLSTPGG